MTRVYVSFGLAGCAAFLLEAFQRPSPANEISAFPPATPSITNVVAPRQAPAILPGTNLTQHDFFYAGEAKTRDMYIVRKGQVIWSYKDDTGKGEISDATLLSNGNVLFAHQFGVTEISSDKKVLWDYPAPPTYEIHTARPIGTDRVLFVENGPKPQLMLVNTTTGKTEREWPLTVKNPLKSHGQFRHISLTDAGTVLAAHMDLGKVSEYNVDGKEIWSVAVDSPWSATRLKNGNTLITSNKKFVREVDASGKIVWEFTPADVADYKVDGFQTATRLPNGNTVINNWTNQWHDKVDPNNEPVQAWEITPDKKVAWALQAWTDPANLGPATTIQLLDEPNAPEHEHFGNIR